MFKDEAGIVELEGVDGYQMGICDVDAVLDGRDNGSFGTSMPLVLYMFEYRAAGLTHAPRAALNSGTRVVILDLTSFQKIPILVSGACRVAHEISELNRDDDDGGCFEIFNCREADRR